MHTCRKHAQDSCSSLNPYVYTEPFLTSPLFHLQAIPKLSLSLTLQYSGFSYELQTAVGQLRLRDLSDMKLLLGN